MYLFVIEVRLQFAQKIRPVPLLVSYSRCVSHHGVDCMTHVLGSAHDLLITSSVGTFHEIQFEIMNLIACCASSAVMLTRVNLRSTSSANKI